MIAISKQKVFSATKKIVFCLLLVYFLVLFSRHGLLLYFGVATVRTTIVFYVSVLVIVYLLIRLLQYFLKARLSDNVKLLLTTLWLSLFISDLALRFVFKQNLTYSEKVAGHYASYYSYVDDWASLKKYLSGKENYWYLTNRSDSSMVYTVEGHKFMHRFNSLGLRDTELSPSPDDSLNLIIGSGDSFTEGVGTDQDST